MSYIEFQDINKYFGQNHVLKGIDLSIEKGELLTLLGSSGCGKSTLLRCLAGLEAVQEGKIYLDGTDITNLDARKREIGMVFQQYSLFPNMTVEQNLAFGLKRKKTGRAEIGAEVEKALDMVGLLDKREVLSDAVIRWTAAESRSCKSNRHETKGAFVGRAFKRH